MKYTFKELETGNLYHWTITEILEEINRDRSDEWSAYDESDWREGWNEWCEGDYYTLVTEPERPISKRAEAARKAGTVLVAYSPGASAREALIDFLTDSLHLFGEEQVRFALDSALIHQQAESGEVLAS